MEKHPAQSSRYAILWLLRERNIVLAKHSFPQTFSKVSLCQEAEKLRGRPLGPVDKYRVSKIIMVIVIIMFIMIIIIIIITMVIIIS